MPETLIRRDAASDRQSDPERNLANSDRYICNHDPPFRRGSVSDCLTRATRLRFSQTPLMFSFQSAADDRTVTEEEGQHSAALLVEEMRERVWPVGMVRRGSTVRVRLET
jgi:hypothetical protein